MTLVLYLYKNCFVFLLISILSMYMLHIVTSLACTITYVNKKYDASQEIIIS